MAESTQSFRFARREDAPLILSFIKGLAAYEKMENEVVADEALLEEWLFDKRAAEVILALEDGREVGLPCFSTTFPPSWGARACTWRICTSFRNTGATAMAKGC